MGRRTTGSRPAAAGRPAPWAAGASGGGAAGCGRGGAGTAPGAGRVTGICGSGIIEAVAELFLAGLIDSDGRFDEAAPARTPRVRFHGRTGKYVLASAADSATGAD